MKQMIKPDRRYFSARKGKPSVSAGEAKWRLESLYILFRNKDYFKEKLRVEKRDTDTLAREAVVFLGFRAFPISQWDPEDITEDHIFDVIEFLYDHISKPGVMVEMPSDSGYGYWDYDSYDESAGKEEFRAAANLMLGEIGEGFELEKDGQIRANGVQGIQHILKAEIVPFDEVHVDSKVAAAIERWRKRHATIEDKKEAVRLLADVFEWLRDTKQLQGALDKKDESDLFNIANNFAIRHHQQAQKANYDKAIWYNWMFHFYLATYHASIRLLLKKRRGKIQEP
jgi:hypothetical protein